MGGGGGKGEGVIFRMLSLKQHFQWTALCVFPWVDGLTPDITVLRKLWHLVVFRNAPINQGVNQGSGVNFWTLPQWCLAWARLCFLLLVMRFVFCPPYHSQLAQQMALFSPFAAPSQGITCILVFSLVPHVGFLHKDKLLYLHFSMSQYSNFLFLFCFNSVAPFCSLLRSLSSIWAPYSQSVLVSTTPV